MVGYWTRELMQRRRGGGATAYWLVSTGFLSLPWSRIQDQKPRGGTTLYGMGPPTLITNRDKVLQLDLMGAFSQSRFYHSDNSTLRVKVT